MNRRLYLVPTPIGNLEDITFRADTRKTGILLKQYGIGTHMESFHKFNEHQKITKYLNLLDQGKCLALVSDAGTPSISDPGFLLVRECLNMSIDIECLPGATSPKIFFCNSAVWRSR